MEYGKTIIYGKDDMVWFYDACGEDEINMFKKETAYKVYGIYEYEDCVAIHQCQKSKIWDDMTGYIDEVNEEIYALNDNTKYNVCWYECDDNYDLLSNVDMNISKQDIINNIIAQKYIEGASIYLASDLKPLM